jgi:Protein of unknown function (DUF1566)/Fibronectin type III domain
VFDSLPTQTRYHLEIVTFDLSWSFHMKSIIVAAKRSSCLALCLLVVSKIALAVAENPFLASGTSASLAYPIVDTGQIKYYNASSEIAAPGSTQVFYGQDAHFSGAQPSYTLSGDSKTVLDNVTKLMWMRGPNTTLSPPVKSDKKSYSNAQAWVATVNALNYGGFSDWRLPGIKELYSLMNFKGTDPSGDSGTNTAVLTPFIDTTYFNFGYGQTSYGERVIDSQYASSNLFVVNPAETGSAKLFGLNLADGRIKGYDLAMPDRTEKTFFMQLVRGSGSYGVNSFADSGDGTIADAATGLVWMKADSGSGMSWQEALAWVQTKNSANHLGYNDWRLPNAKELHSLVNYANAPDYNGKPAIDTTFFTSTAITNENGEADYPYYWTSTTHAGYSSSGSGGGGAAVYIPFGRALGWPDGAAKWVDVHGAGAQRSDPKIGPPYAYATTHTVNKNGKSYSGYAFGPQGDTLRGANFVRMVRTIDALPGTPTIGSITLSNGSASIGFTPSASGGSATSFAATCTPTQGGDSITGSASTSPISVSGLSAGTTYRCTVTATNGAGTGTASSSITMTLPTATSVPSSPTMTSAVASRGSAQLNFTAPAGGSAITGYTVSCTAPGQTTRSNSGTTAPIVVRGLTGGMAYSCSVLAYNTVGASNASAAIMVTPLPALNILPSRMLMLFD